MMSNGDKQSNEVVGFASKALWWIGRLKLVGIIIGVIGTITIQLLGGFWQFRTDHQEVIRSQYTDTLNAHKAFQRQLERFNVVFEGIALNDLATNPTSEIMQDEVAREILMSRTYSEAAQAYIREINEISRLLPSTQESLASYIGTISSLRQYYIKTDLPEMGSVEWVIFYGKFRKDIDKYLVAREHYLAELADEVGSYWRSIVNS